MVSGLSEADDVVATIVGAASLLDADPTGRLSACTASMRKYFDPQTTSLYCGQVTGSLRFIPHPTADTSFKDCYYLKKTIKNQIRPVKTSKGH